MSDANRIWTMGRMFGALGLTVVAYLAATRLMLAWPDPMLFGHFQLVCAGLGLVVGWRVIGSRLGYGSSAAIAAGVTAALVLLVATMLVVSVYEAMARNMSMGSVSPDVVMTRYWTMVTGWARNMTDPFFWAILFGGGALTGLLAERFSTQQA